MTSKPIDARQYPREENDFYPEPSWAVELLLGVEEFKGTIWDPACGYGTIPKACIAHGLEAFGTDIADRGYGTKGQNFLAFRRGRVSRAENIITNPPYNLAEKFIDQALRFTTGKVAVLVQSKFLNSIGRYDSFTSHWPVCAVHILSSRPSMLPGRFVDPDTGLCICDDPEPKLHKKTGEYKPRWRKGDAPKGGSIDFCWVVMDHQHRGGPKIDWLSRPESLDRYRATQARKNTPKPIKEIAA